MSVAARRRSAYRHAETVRAVAVDPDVGELGEDAVLQVVAECAHAGGVVGEAADGQAARLAEADDRRHVEAARAQSPLLVAADDQNYMERAYLDELARQLKLDDALRQRLEQEFRDATG